MSVFLPKIEFENIWDYNEKFRLNLDHLVRSIVVVGSFARNTHICLGNSDNSETNQHSRTIYTCIVERLFHITHIYLDNSDNSETNQTIENN